MVTYHQSAMGMLGSPPTPMLESSVGRALPGYPWLSLQSIWLMRVVKTLTAIATHFVIYAIRKVIWLNLFQSCPMRIICIIRLGKIGEF